MSISRRQLLASTAWSALAGAAPARRSLAQAEVHKPPMTLPTGLRWPASST